MVTRYIAITAIAIALAASPGFASAYAQTAETGAAAVSAVEDAAPAGLTLDWRVENPFRFFTDPADTEVHRATWLALTEAERNTPVLSAERALAERHNGEGWAQTMVNDTCWDPKRNRYGCKAAGDYVNPAAHRIVASLKGVEDGEVECTWLTTPRAKGRRGTAVKAPCGEPVKLDIPYPGGASLAVEVGGRKVAEQAVNVRDLLVVGLGDSFASGEGNPDSAVRFSRERSTDYGDAAKGAQMLGYPARAGDWKLVGDKSFLDSNPRWLDQACHRSLYSHQLRAALQLAIEQPDRAVTFVSYACSGAEITEGLFLRYKGHEWVPTPPDLSQLSATAQTQCGNRQAPAYDLPEAYHLNGRVPALQGGLVLRKCDIEYARPIDLLMLSIGGNDIGFSRLVANAVLSDESTLRKIGGWMGQVQGFIEASQQLDRLIDRYKALNRAFHNILHLPWQETDRVLLTSYPPMALLDDGRSLCPDGRAGMTVAPDFALSTEKARDSTVAAERLQSVMTEASRVFGWTLVETHRQAFSGRSICSGFSSLALSTADDLRLPQKVDGAWTPYNPADFRAYATRQRWFRTPNDAFLTGNFHVSQSLMQKAVPLATLSWMQVLLASLYSGAFHPTAEGQAAMADAVVVEARRVLRKYEGRQRHAER